jgi:hypothetical protein
MKSRFEGLRPGDPRIVDANGRQLGLILRLVPETPEEVADLKRFCRLTDAFRFVIDDGYRSNSAHIAPVYGERMFEMLTAANTDEDEE